MGLIKVARDPLILWKDILDLGVALSLANFKKTKGKKEAFQALNKSLWRQSEEHWQGLRSVFRKLSNYE